MNFVGVVEAHDLVKFAWITATIWEPWLQLGCSYARISDQRHPIMNGILLHKFAFDTHCWQLLAAQLDNSPNLGTYLIDGRGRYNLQKEIWKICGHIAGIPTQLVCMELEFQLVTMDWNVNTVEFEEATKGPYIFWILYSERYHYLLMSLCKYHVMSRIWDMWVDQINSYMIIAEVFGKFLWCNVVSVLCGPPTWANKIV
jgi:hypothetical protein